MTDFQRFDLHMAELSQVTFTFEGRQSRCDVTARLAEQVLHRDRIDVSSALARSTFAREVVARLRNGHAVETTVDEIGDMLLRQIEALELCNNDSSSHAPGNAIPALPYRAFTVPGPDFGVYRTKPDVSRITNFIPVIELETVAHDAGDQQRTLIGKIRLSDREIPWKLDAQAFAIDQMLKTSLYETAGVGLEINCKMDELRNAIGMLSQPDQRETTVDFGWSVDGTVFRVPGANISASGWHPAGHGELTVDLSETDIASKLQLLAPVESQIQYLMTQVIPALLQVAPNDVIYPLLGFTWLPILASFIPDVKPFCLWLVGPSGVGKSYAARLFQRFYGSFSTFLSWTSTANALQMSGYYFRNALALIDDYKPETVNQRDVIRLIQNYADGSARSRLRRDATLNWSRPFRGWMVSSGEDLPERSASMIARCSVLRVRKFEKNLTAASVCAGAAHMFPQLTSAFIQHVLTANRRQAFVDEVQRKSSEFHGQLVDLENGARIATNFALLSAAFTEAVGFLFPVSDHHAMLSRMSQIIQGMILDVVGETTQQALHTVFLQTLQSLFIDGLARIEGDSSAANTSGTPRGSFVGRVSRRGAHLIDLNLKSAIAAVDHALNSQGKTPLQCSSAALQHSMHSAGLLYDDSGAQLPTNYTGPLTFQTTIQHSNLRCVIIHEQSLGRSTPPVPPRPAGINGGPLPAN